MLVLYPWPPRTCCRCTRMTSTPWSPWTRRFWRMCIRTPSSDSEISSRNPCSIHFWSSWCSCFFCNFPVKEQSLFILSRFLQWVYITQTTCTNWAGVSLCRYICSDQRKIFRYFTGYFSSGRLQPDIPEGLRPHHRRHVLPLRSPQSRPQESHRTESSDAHFSAGWDTTYHWY